MCGFSYCITPYNKPVNGTHTLKGHGPHLVYCVKVGSISHAVKSGIYHMVCISIPHDHLVCFSTMWHTFLKMCIHIQNIVC